MYIVKIYNDGIPIEIHGDRQKLKTGKVVKGINTIDTFSFSILPVNNGFNKIKDFKTLVTVYNENKRRYEFCGRVLYSKTAMSDNGLISKEVTCESYFGFLCDSQQLYVEEKNWTVEGLLQRIIDIHNSQVEEYKHFALGKITVTDPNNNLYCGIQRETTWDTLNKKLIDVLGGEIRFRVVDDTIYIDYLTEIGETKATSISLSKNMKAITKEKDPSAYVTRLIPLGCKLTREETITDEDGNTSTETVETEERLDISSVNDGKIYLDDELAIEEYGIHIAYQEWDDVTEAINLKTKGENWLIENNKLLIKYAITALDLSLLGLDIDDFEVHNYHPIENALLGIDDTARIIKKTIDVCEDNAKSSIEVGENFKTLSDISIEQSGKIDIATETIEKIESDYVTNERLFSETHLLNSLIKQKADNILLQINEGRVWTETGVTLKSVTPYYYAANELDDVEFDIEFGWSQSIPTLSETDNCLFCGEVIEHSDGSRTNTTPTAIALYNSQQITGIEDYYATNINSKKPANIDEDGNESDLEWSTDIPQLSLDARYLWKYSVVTYADGSTTETTKRVIGKYGLSYSEFSKEIETQLSIMSGEILMNFTTTTEQIVNVDGDLQTKFTELYEYIKFAGGTITLGASDSPITLTIENDIINFKKNGVSFSSWDGDNFRTGNIVVDLSERAQFGNFAFVPRSDGSLSFLKVGDA